MFQPSTYLTNRRRTRPAALVVSAVLAVGAATAAVSTASAESADERGTSITLTLPQEPESWNYWEVGANALRVPTFYNVQETLLENLPDGTIIPMLAEVSEDDEDARQGQADVGRPGEGPLPARARPGDEQTEEGADRQGDGRRHHTDVERVAGAEHQLRHDVASELVGAEHEARASRGSQPVRHADRLGVVRRPENDSRATPTNRARAHPRAVARVGTGGGFDAWTRRPAAQVRPRVCPDGDSGVSTITLDSSKPVDLLSVADPRSRSPYVMSIRKFIVRIISMMTNVSDSPGASLHQRLLAANPGIPAADEIGDIVGQRFTVIRGSVPGLGGFPAGCRFRNRCDFALASCEQSPPTTDLESGHRYRCWNPVGGAADAVAG